MYCESVSSGRSRVVARLPHWGHFVSPGSRSRGKTTTSQPNAVTGRGEVHARAQLVLSRKYP